MEQLNLERILAGSNEYRLKVSTEMQINTELLGFSQSLMPVTAFPRYFNSNYWDPKLNNIRFCNDGTGRMTNPNNVNAGMPLTASYGSKPSKGPDSCWEAMKFPLACDLVVQLERIFKNSLWKLSQGGTSCGGSYVG